MILTVPPFSWDGDIHLTQWLVANGARVSADQLICEIECETSCVELPAPSGGVLEQLVREGMVLRPDQAIARIRPVDDQTSN